ncbi:MAG: hypothetical protein ONB12_07840 [candidate division KSB1 bacterium]|nr:hypothetical protein [candidate division KSB1 bacterium]
MLIGVARPQAAQTQTDAGARLKSKVAAIVLKDGRVLRGRIVKVQRIGILFDPQRSSPFYDPPPQVIPLGSISQMQDAAGRVVWRNPAIVKASKTPPKIKYKGAFSVDAGPAFYLRSVRQPFSAPNWQNWKETMRTGTGFKAEGMMLLRRKYGIGAAYEHRGTTANYTGILWVGGTGVQQIRKSKIGLDVYWLKGYFWQPVSKILWVHLDSGVGMASFSAEPLAEERVKLNAPVFSAGAGADLFLTRETAFAAGFNFLFGQVGKESLGSTRVQFQHGLTQFAVYAGLKIWF